MFWNTKKRRHLEEREKLLEIKAQMLESYRNRLINFRNKLSGAKTIIDNKILEIKKYKEKLDKKKAELNIQEQKLHTLHLELSEKREEYHKREQEIESRLKEINRNIENLKTQSIENDKNRKELEIKLSSIENREKTIQLRESQLNARAIEIERRTELFKEQTKQVLDKDKKDNEEKEIVQVGLDFGTSTIKMVYYHFESNRHSPVLFNHGLEDYPNFCLPCVAAIDKEGRLLLAEEAVEELGCSSWSKGIRRLKMMVAGNVNPVYRNEDDFKEFEEYIEQHPTDYQLTPEDISILLIAFSIRHCKKFLNNQPEYSGKRLRVNTNFGIPLDQYQDKRIKQKFESIFSEAYNLERYWFDSLNDRFYMLKILLELRREKNQFTGEDDSTSVIPECVALIKPFIDSTERKLGKYAIMDFGDGTVDISICNICNTNSYTIYWYSSRIIPKGMNAIVKLIARDIQEKTGELNVTFSKIINYYRQERLINNSEIHSKIKEYLLGIYYSDEFKMDAWGKAYRDHLRSLEEWINDVEIFKTGGGSIFKEIDEVFKNPWDGNLVLRNVIYKLKNLSKPRDFNDNHNKTNFDRMAVAYGLSFPVTFLSGFNPPSESPDQTPQNPPIIDYDPDDNYFKN